MVRLIIRKLLLMLVILVSLNYVAYHYAIRHPNLFFYPFTTIPNPDAAPIESHYDEYVHGLLRGDLGQVGIVGVGEIVREAIRYSLVLVSVAAVVGLGLGLLFGFLAI